MNLNYKLNISYLAYPDYKTCQTFFPSVECY